MIYSLRALALPILLVVMGCNSSEQVQSLRADVDRLELELDSLRTQMLESRPAPPIPRFLKTLRPLNVRSSPIVRDDNLFGMLNEGNYAEALEFAPPWYKVRIISQGSTYDGFIHSSSLESAGLNEDQYLERAQYNHFRLSVSPAVKTVLSSLRRTKGIQETIGLEIKSNGPADDLLRRTIVNFFVNIDSRSFKLKELELGGVASRDAFACVVEVTVFDKRRQQIRVLDRGGAILFDQFVDFNLID